MEIKLDDRFKAVFVTKDNIELHEYRESVDRKTKKPKMIWAWEGYYTSLRGLLKGYLKISTVNPPEGIKSLSDMADHIDRIEEKIDRILLKED